MPPYVRAKCTNEKCKHPENRYDLAELRKKEGGIMRRVIASYSEDKTEEFEVTCQTCGRKFKITVKED
ncbi:MAG: hypothetical protein HND47_14565 [Chloroflexi bacterium]|nr:hypothetical protein [Chloroflexota bacterium]